MYITQYTVHTPTIHQRYRQKDWRATFNSNTALCGDLAQPLTQQERPVIRDDYCYKCKKLTSLKLIVRTMRRHHSTKTAKIFWVTLDGATHGASIKCPAPCIATSRVTQKIFAVLVEWYRRIVLTMSFKLVSFFYIYLCCFTISHNIHVQTE